MMPCFINKSSEKSVGSRKNVHKLPSRKRNFQLNASLALKLIVEQLIFYTVVCWGVDYRTK